MSEAESSAPEMEPVESFDEEVSAEPQMEEYDSWDDIPEATDLDIENDNDALIEKETKLENEELNKEVEEVASEEESEDAKVDEPASEEKEEIEDKKEGDQNLDEKLIEVKIDGKTEEVSLQDLKNNYSGKVAYDKKFSELDTERTAYKKEIDDINKYVTELGDTMTSKSMLEGYYKVGEMVNIPPHVIKAQLIKELVPEIDRLRDLSQPEIDLEHQRAENEYLTTKYEADKNKTAAEQASSELQSKIDSVRANHNVEQEEWDKAFKHLDETLPPADVITPELMENAIIDSRISLRAEKALSEFEATLSEDAEVVASLKNIMKENPDFDDNDIKEILDQSYNKPKEQAIAQKIEKKVDKQPLKPKQELEEYGDDMSWDDLF